jgi:hypothetical protein
MRLLGKKKKRIAPDTFIQRRNDLLFNEIDGEVVMLSIENGEYYGMDQVGTQIWEIIENPISFKDLINKLCEHYNVTEELCVKDTQAFISQLFEKNLLISNY